MSHNTRPISPLRQRMIDDIMMCKLTPGTRSQYLRAVINLTCFLGRSPDTATPEDLRRYQLHLLASTKLVGPNRHSCVHILHDHANRYNPAPG